MPKGVRSYFLVGHSLILTVLAASICSGVSAAADTALTDRVDALLAPLIVANEFSGAAVLTRGGRVLYQRGFGMASHAASVAFTSDTPADGGSLAKPFTAAGLLWLAQEGRVELDAAVTRYLPDFPHEQTTARQLLSHSNGLPPDYSNFAFDLAALVIEKVTGQTYEAFLSERFFTRLAMCSSFARPARLADWQGIRTLGYGWTGSNWELVDVFDMEAFLGASNLYFSTTDLARWASATAARNATPVEVAESGQSRSYIGGHPSSINTLSWYCDDTNTRCYYTGDINAFHGFVNWDRGRDEAVGFLSNSSLPPWSTITLQRDLVDALAARPKRADALEELERYEKKARSVIAGTYFSDDVGVVRVRFDTQVPCTSGPCSWRPQRGEYRTTLAHGALAHGELAPNALAHGASAQHFAIRRVDVRCAGDVKCPPGLKIFCRSLPHDFRVA